MTKEIDKKILKDIYSSQDKISAALNIVEIMKDKRDLIGEIILDSLKTKDHAFQNHDYNEAITICKELDKKISIGFDTTLSFGFIKSLERKINFL